MSPTATMRRIARSAAIVAAVFSAILAAAGSASALSELKELPPAAESGEQPPAERPGLPPLEGPQVGPDGGLPQPAPIIRPGQAPVRAEDATGAEPPEATTAPAPEILHDPALLPEPAARMRQLIIEAARTGDPHRLRPLLGTGPGATRLSLAPIEEDPVEYIQSISGDGEGLEILAIMLDLLDAGFARLDAGDGESLYVWPYFAAVPLDSLTPAQKVELLRVVTAGDVEDMAAFGSYNFYRIGISPDGEWRYFFAGD